MKPTKNVFGITDDRVKQLEKFFKHCEIEATSYKDMADKLDINNGGEVAFKSFMYGIWMKEKEEKEKMNKIFENLGFE